MADPITTAVADALRSTYPHTPALDAVAATAARAALLAAAARWDDQAAELDDRPACTTGQRHCWQMLAEAARTTADQLEYMANQQACP